MNARVLDLGRARRVRAALARLDVEAARRRAAGEPLALDLGADLEVAAALDLAHGWPAPAPLQLALPFPGD